MEIKYLGHSSFLIKFKDLTLLTDPFDPKMVGLAFPAQKADVVVISHHHRDHDYIEAVSGPVKRPEVFVIDRPGEYEIGGVEVKTTSVFHDNNEGKDRGSSLMSLLRIEDIFILHLGDLGHDLSEKKVEEFDLVDVLLVPVGGVYTIDAKQAVKIVNQLQPSIVIPMHYKQDKMDEGFAQLATVDNFINEGNFEDVEREEKLKLVKTELPEETKVVIMDNSH